jgi:hypothetical protein
MPSLLEGGAIFKCSVWSAEDYSRLEFIEVCKSNLSFPSAVINMYHFEYYIAHYLSITLTVKG